MMVISLSNFHFSIFRMSDHSALTYQDPVRPLSGQVKFRSARISPLQSFHSRSWVRMISFARLWLVRESGVSIMISRQPHLHMPEDQQNAHLIIVSRPFGDPRHPRNMPSSCSNASLQASWWVNQSLRRISFESFSCLTTLHVPFQLLLGADRGLGVGPSLPKSFVNLWLNDDGMALWFNHGRYTCGYTECNDSWSHPGIFQSPMRTDAETVEVMSEFLTQWHIHVSKLKLIRLIFYLGDLMHWHGRYSGYTAFLDTWKHRSRNLGSNSLHTSFPGGIETPLVRTDGTSKWSPMVR
ncbi:hypothetical protein D6C93_06352 [Aureobasidium pullulans]|nr:hypothetical protein D6C93_06352 [Aureobasidium pullulans]